MPKRAKTYRVVEVAEGVLGAHRRPERGEDAAGQDARRPHPGAHGQVGPRLDLQTVALRDTGIKKLIR